jgi:hypothetical protein
VLKLKGSSGSSLVPKGFLPANGGKSKRFNIRFDTFAFMGSSGSSEPLSCRSSLVRSSGHNCVSINPFRKGPFWEPGSDRVPTHHICACSIDHFVIEDGMTNDVRILSISRWTTEEE